MRYLGVTLDHKLDFKANWSIAERLEKRLSLTGIKGKKDLSKPYDARPLCTIIPSEYVVSQIFKAISLQLPPSLAASPKCPGG